MDTSPTDDPRAAFHPPVGRVWLLGLGGVARNLGKDGRAGAAGF
jgi:hypothetical protein